MALAVTTTKNWIPLGIERVKTVVLETVLFRNLLVFSLRIIGDPDELVDEVTMVVNCMRVLFMTFCLLSACVPLYVRLFFFSIVFQVD